MEKVSNENTAMKFITQTMKLDELAGESIIKHLKQDNTQQIKEMANFHREAQQQTTLDHLSTRALEKRRVKFNKRKMRKL